MTSVRFKFQALVWESRPQAIRTKETRNEILACKRYVQRIVPSMEWEY